MKSPIERIPPKSIDTLPKRGEGNQLDWDKENRLAMSKHIASDGKAVKYIIGAIHV